MVYLPKIGHIVLCKEIMKNEEGEQTVLVEPFSNIDAKEFPHTCSFWINIGLFNFNPGLTYEFAYFLYTPHGDKIEGSFFKLQPSSKKNEGSVHFNINVNLNDIHFKEEGVYSFNFQIVNLHEEKRTFFYVKNSPSGDTNE